jgi:hypothetical protein
VEPYADSVIKIQYVVQQAVKTKYAYVGLSLAFIWSGFIIAVLIRLLQMIRDNIFHGVINHTDVSKWYSLHKSVSTLVVNMVVEERVCLCEFFSLLASFPNLFPPFHFLLPHTP